MVAQTEPTHAMPTVPSKLFSKVKKTLALIVGVLAMYGIIKSL